MAAWRSRARTAAVVVRVCERARPPGSRCLLSVESRQLDLGPEMTHTHTHTGWPTKAAVESWRSLARAAPERPREREHERDEAAAASEEECRWNAAKTHFQRGFHTFTRRRLCSIWG